MQHDLHREIEELADVGILAKQIIDINEQEQREDYYQMKNFNLIK